MSSRFLSSLFTQRKARSTYPIWDVVLAVLLLIGSVTGAQMGAQFAQKARPVQLRLALAVIVLIVALRLAWGLGVRPDEIFTVTPI